MRLNQLFIENFGLYRGAQSINLANRVSKGARRPIILFGGMNGDGKTTILEAVQLALYGRAALGQRVRQIDYESYLRSRIHRTRGGGPQADRAMVGVEFEFHSMGTRSVYEVRRSWTASPKRETGVKEDLEVLCNGEPVGEVDRQHWQDFIRELVPPGLSQLFFFDGEKIQKLAEEDDQTLLSESINALLGLDTVERLQADLRIYSDRELKHQGSDRLVKQLAAREEDIARLEGQLTALRDRRAVLSTSAHGAGASVRNLEDKLTRLGGRFADTRSELQENRSKLQAEVSTLERRLRELAEGVLPFVFCPQLSQRLLDQMDQEAQTIGNRIFGQRAHKVFDEVSRRLRGTARNRQAQAHAASIDRVLAVLCEELTREAGPTDKPALHDYSDALHHRLKSWFERAQGEVSEELRRTGASLELATRNLQATEMRLQQIPQDDALAPVLGDLTSAMRRQATFDAEQESVDEQLEALHRELDHATRQRDQLRAKLDESTAHSGRLDIVRRSNLVLEDYRKRLLDEKIQALQHEITQCLRHLLRKGDLIHRIAVCATTFAVTLYDSDGNQLDKAELSAGEKQMYAIAVLWGLARTSGRPLPMIIDTPLGRLDSSHRSNLVERYFPHASHQVIILSTDEEIDEEFFQALSPDISHAFRLQYDSGQASTTVQEGYFWRKAVHS